MSLLRRTAHSLCLVAIVLLLAGCESKRAPEYRPSFSSQPVRAKTVYLFGVHPLHNPQRLYEVFSPLMSHLSEQIDEAEFRLEASRDYASYDAKLYGRHFHFALPNPYQTVQSTAHGYRVFGKMDDDENFRGIILVRRDSGIDSVQDLVGQSVSYPAPTALAATMLPQYYLQSHGVDVMTQLDNRYVGSQESSIMNVFLGETTAGATWPPPWRALVRERPELLRALEVKWRTDPLPNNGLVVRDDIPDGLVRQVSQVLFHLQDNPVGRTILDRMELSRFTPADDNTYQPVRDFLARFSAQVRPVL
ncbi:MAG: phosphate/phosphite/phosphonate ABC transporter substrate-binding protein [Chromatiales bacterium]|nr:phosphate/phosphite/phosphonate ABC transporter substrate-binding protein [Chromatiales bacterium]